MTSAIKLKCSFDLMDWGGHGSLYTCNVLQKTERRYGGNLLELIEGSHTSYNSNKNVKAFRVNDKSFNFIPNNIADFFPNVITFQILNSGLQKIEKENFNGLYEMTDLNLWKNQLRQIDENTFDHCNGLLGLYLSNNHLTKIYPLTFLKLANLAVLHLNNNEIKSLPLMIFYRNMNIKELHLQNNRIAQIPYGSLNNVMNSQVDLSNNICISFKMIQSTQIDALKAELIKCDSYYTQFLNI